MRRPDYDLTSLRLFIAVCDHGNIARVAEQEHMVSSAVSKRMAQLEQQAGSALLERRRYGVRPTPAGETVLAYAQEMLSIARRLDDAMHGYSSGVRGQVRVLANASVMAEALADDVVAFMQMPQYANIRIDIEGRLSPAVISGVREGSASVGIVWNRVDLHELQSRPYRCDHLGIVVHREHPLALAKTPSVAFADTLDFDYVGMHTGSLPGTSSIQRLFEQTALAHGKRLRGKVMVSSYESAMRVVSAQLAICVVPIELFGEAAAYQKLVHIPLTDDWAVRQFVLCYRDEAALSPSALAFVRHLAAD